MIYDFEIWLIKFEAGLYFSTIDAEIQYIAIGCQMGRNFQILIWTAFANIATQCSFNANKFLTEIFNSQTFVTKWLKHRIEQPVIQDRAPEGQIPGLFDCCHCFHRLLIVSMIASFICWLLSGASQLVSVYYSCFISRSWKQAIVFSACWCLIFYWSL